MKQEDAAVRRLETIRCMWYMYIFLFSIEPFFFPFHRKLDQKNDISFAGAHPSYATVSWII